MTQVTPADGTAPRRTRAGGRRVASATLVAAALLAGLALGRFVLPQRAPVTPSIVAAAASLEEQIAAAERAAHRAPGDPAAWRTLAQRALAGTAATGDPALVALAERALERAEELAPGEVATTVGRATVALTRHRFAEALELGQSALAAQPGQTDALAVVVDAHVELGHLDDAAARLQELLDVRPGVAALSRVSYLRELRGDLDGAVVAMGQARTAAAGTPTTLATVTTLLGDLHWQRGALPAARRAYDAALAVAPGTVRAELGLIRVEAATAVAEDRGLGPTIRRLDALVARAPLPEAAILRSELHRTAGDAAAAADADDVVRAMIDLQRTGGQVVDLEMALFEADHGDPDRAVTLARAAYADRRTVATADALGWALTRAGDAPAAAPYVAESLRLGTRDARVRWHAAVAAAATGDEAAAAAHLRDALDVTPWFTFSQRGDVEALARRLGVDAGGAWRASP